MRRREFLTTSVTSATLLGLAGTSVAGVGPVSLPDEFNRTRFRSWLNQEFRIVASGSLRSAPARLVAIDDGPAQAGLNQFSILFKGSEALPRGLCWLSHPDGAHFMLHLDGAPGSGRRRAHFSLLEPRHV
jgi:hypothetical protein